MFPQRITLLALILGALLLPSGAAAQSATSGTIAGTVRDATGAVLPGVTVEAASPALIEKVRSAVTDDQGNYKIVDLRPGTYTVTFTLPGFSTFKREGLELTTGFTAPANAELKVGSLEETVTVTGASPVVDVQNVRQQLVFKKAEQEALPLAKNIMQWAAVVPGAVLGASASQDVGGTAAKQGFFAIHGGTPTTSTGLYQEGMSFSAQDTGFGLLVNSAAMEEATIQTASSMAESQVSNAQVNIVPRDGGNTYRLSSSGNFSSGALQQDNVSDELIARGGRTAGDLRYVRLLNLGVGGPIKRDRLWFLGAFQWSGSGRYTPGNFFNATPNTLFYTPDLNKQAYTDDTEQDRQFRVTWQVTAKNKVAVHLFKPISCLCYFLSLSPPPAPEAATRIDVNAPMQQATWSYPATNRLLFEAGVTVVQYIADRPRHTGVTQDTISVLDSSRNYRYGSLATGTSGIGAYGPDDSNQSNQRFSTSYVTGSHAVKVGIQTLWGWRTDRSDINHDISYTFNGRTPIGVTLFATPTIIRDRAQELSLYGQDQWTVSRWTLNLGLRYDYFKGTIPDQHSPAGTYVPARDYPGLDNVPNWKDIAPRIGAAYDLFGNGKTAVKAFVGRYVDWANAGITVAPSNPMNTVVNSVTRTWSDVNGDYVPQENELGPLSNVNFGKPVVTTRRAEDLLLGWGTRGYGWQTSFQIQHELWPGMGVNVGYFRNWWGNFTVTDNLAVAPSDFSPFCITAPRDARLPGGGGNQICGLYDVSPTKFGLVDNLITMASNYGKQTRIFDGVDATFNWRFGQGAFVSGGLATGALVTDSCDVIVDSPQTRFCRVEPSWGSGTQLKLSAIYPLPWDLRLSATYQNIPGIPQTAQYVATNAEIAPSLGRNLGQCRGAAVCNGTVTVELIEPNTQFEKRLNQVDLRFTRLFKINRARVSGNIDVGNLFNDSSVLALNSRFGPSWLQPNQILGGRILKFGFQLDM
jgi:hypothetical protein